MNSSNTFANRNLNGDLNGDLNRMLNQRSHRGNGLRASTASPRRTAICSALAALGLAGGLIISPSLASAATGDPIDPIDPVDFELSITPQTSSGGLSVTGTDLTSVMFALGLTTLGAGSVIALATRRREESSIL